MLIEEAVRRLLIADLAIVTLVGTRIYPVVLPETVSYPALAYRLVERDREAVLENRSTGLFHSRFRFFSTHKSESAYASVKLLDEAIRLCLEGFTGTVTADTSTPPAPPDFIVIQDIQPASSYDFYDDPTQTHQVISDYDVWAEETLPA